MEYYRLLLYVIFGILPSLTWLFYYLGKDLHPEPKKMILKVFLYGSISTIPVFFIQLGLIKILGQFQGFGFFNSNSIAIDIIKWFFVIAFTEEIFKYAVVVIATFHSDVLDEPTDIMLYMVIVALGFAAVENMLYLFSPTDNVSFDIVVKTTLVISFIRFIGATFLHTLCSAALGYFVAMSFLATKKRLQLTIVGIIVAVFLHGLYNFSIVILKAPFNFVVPAVIIAGLASFVTFGFYKTRRMKSISNI